MKDSIYESSGKGTPFGGEGRHGQALRIMEALSGVDEELLERSGAGGLPEYTASSGNRGGKAGNGKRVKPLWQYARPWAAVLCLAVVGALGWGGYRMAMRSNDGASGGNSNDMAMRLEDAETEVDGEAAPEEAGAAQHAAEGAAEDTTAQKTDEWEKQENAGDPGRGTDTGGANDADGTSQHTDYEKEGQREETANMGIAQGSASKEGAAEENIIADTGSCPTANQEKLTEEEARSRSGLGNYIPEKIPQGYTFESAFCNTDLQEANLTVVWTRGMDTIMWSVVQAEKVPETVDIGVPETYDVRLYEIPHAETVPEEYRQSVDDPTFAQEDFTQDAVRSRMVSYDDSGDTDTPRGNFSVLYPDNVVIKFNGRGTAEEIWAMFDSMAED